MKVAVDSVLGEVRKKKSDVAKMLELIGNLSKLRKIRKENVAKKGVFACFFVSILWGGGGHCSFFLYPTFLHESNVSTQNNHISSDCGKQFEECHTWIYFLLRFVKFIEAWKKMSFLSFGEYLSLLLE